MMASKPATHLFFAQHGLALSKEEDPRRPLSQEGILQTRSVARQFLETGRTISHIFHSGKCRAAQTAEIFASEIEVEKVSLAQYMSPNDDVSIFTQSLDTENALYVGHLPHLNKTVSLLLKGDENSDVITFQNSAMAYLQKTEVLYKLQWLLLPK